VVREAGSVGRRYTGSFLALDGNLLLKYPFSVGNASIFPLLGFGFNIVMSASIEGERFEPGNGATTSNLSSVRIPFGIGGDFGEFGELGRWFIRVAFLPYVHFSGFYFRDLARWYNGRAPSHFGGGARIGVGFRL